ncbi:GIY-YIG nuclease family protein [Patescibacteria group bacterium]|nr:GIY-YIG nuclease family protein [Patescibacteria group bacterium]
MFYVYLIKNEKGELYYGYTNNLRRRLLEHNSSKSSYTRNHKWQLIYYEAYLERSDAYDREKHLKHYGQSLSHILLC